MSGKIVSYKDYVAGWLDSSIHDFLEALSPTPATAKFALITRLDSNPDPVSLRRKSPELRSMKALQVLGSGLLIPTEVLLNAEVRHRIFFGFDEAWFFPHESIEPKPEPASMVGPARLNRARLKKIGKWMSDNS